MKTEASSPRDRSLPRVTFDSSASSESELQSDSVEVNASELHLQPSFKHEVTVAGLQVDALLDTGANTNFITEELAASLQLPLTARPCRVKLASGEIVNSGTRVSDVPTCFRGKQHDTDFIVMPALGSHQVILGTGYMRALGLCLDFARDRVTISQTTAGESQDHNTWAFFRLSSLKRKSSWKCLGCS